MQNKDTITKMLEHCQQIQAFTAGFDHQQFVTAPAIKEACVFCLLQVGELVSKIDGVFVEENGNVPWKKLKGFRNRLVHDYGNVDFTIVWNVIENDMPELIAALKKAGGVA